MRETIVSGLCGISVSIEAVSMPKEPLSFIGRCAGESTARSGRNDAKRAITCIHNGHLSVLEHVSVTFRAVGISRTCSHQLVRHRLASYTQQSQRYLRLDLDPESNEWYVTPPIIEKNNELRYDYEKRMRLAAYEYEKMLQAGIHAEDARYILPEATKTAITVTMNLRELSEFLRQRMDSHAQWEIRELARLVLTALFAATSDDAEWGKLLCEIAPEVAKDQVDACMEEIRHL